MNDIFGSCFGFHIYFTYVLSNNSNRQQLQPPNCPNGNDNRGPSRHLSLIHISSKEYIPLEYPAVPCFEVLQALVQAAREQGRRYHTGVIQCKDSFYGQHQPESMPNVSELTAKWQAWVRAGVLASEMETAALFTVAAVRKVRAGALMMAVWNQEREKQGLSNTRLSDTSPAIETAVAAMEKLILQDKANHDLPAI